MSASWSSDVVSGGRSNVDGVVMHVIVLIDLAPSIRILVLVIVFSLRLNLYALLIPNEPLQVSIEDRLVLLLGLVDIFEGRNLSFPNEFESCVLGGSWDACGNLDIVFRKG